MIVVPKDLKSLPTLFLLFLALTATAQAQYSRLSSYNIDASQISLSGLSSGADMTVQFEVAYSSLVKGVGVIAGSPYYCAEGQQDRATGVCTCFFACSGESVDLSKLVEVTKQNAVLGKIDNPSNMGRHRVWLLSGTKDQLVPQQKMDALSKYYTNFIDKGQIFYKKDLPTGHAMPTDLYGNPCDTEVDPYINNCRYDAAGEMLKWIYGDIQPRNEGKLGGSFIQFDQSEFIPNPGDHSMAADGWLYVPAQCSDRSRACKLHVTFHGCSQYETYSWWDYSFPYYHSFGRKFVDHAGYNTWADTNDMIVLYPQATNSNAEGNLLGCWDWWGYDDANYAFKNGRQMAAIKMMIDRIAGAALSNSSGDATSSNH